MRVCAFASMRDTPVVSALAQIGSVIRNPEVQKLVPFLLSAISDPSTGTKVGAQCSRCDALSGAGAEAK